MLVEHTYLVYARSEMSSLLWDGHYLTLIRVKSIMWSGLSCSLFRRETIWLEKHFFTLYKDLNESILSFHRFAGKSFDLRRVQVSSPKIFHRVVGLLSSRMEILILSPYRLTRYLTVVCLFFRLEFFSVFERCCLWAMLSLNDVVFKCNTHFTFQS